MEFTIGHVSQLLGISRLTLVRWERAGLIPTATRRRMAKWRYWSQRDIEKIKEVMAERTK